jgi:hypothetical protein
MGKLVGTPRCGVSDASSGATNVVGCWYGASSARLARGDGIPIFRDPYRVIFNFPKNELTIQSTNIPYVTLTGNTIAYGKTD